MKLLVYEHLCACGEDDAKFLHSVFCEGFGMLKTFVMDAVSANHIVTTVINKKIAEFAPAISDNQFLVSSRVEAENVFEEAAKDADAVFVIAPETGCILQRLVHRVEQSDLLCLNSSSNAISEASDKTRLGQKGRELGFETPKTLFFEIGENVQEVAQSVWEVFEFPVVVKPADGVGCEGLSVVYHDKKLMSSIVKAATCGSGSVIVQQLVCGFPASVTLVSNGEEAVPITLNRQNISLRTTDSDSTYNGGTVPFENKNRDAAFEVAKKLVESIDGLKGYVGVDMVLTERGPVVIEVNPRLTTSYIGIRKVLTANLADSMVKCATERQLPQVKGLVGYAHIEKVEVKNPTMQAAGQSHGIPEMVSPPFPFAQRGYSCALLCSHGLTIQQAIYDLAKANQRLEGLCQDGGV